MLRTVAARLRLATGINRYCFEGCVIAADLNGPWDVWRSRMIEPTKQLEGHGTFAGPFTISHGQPRGSDSFCDPVQRRRHQGSDKRRVRGQLLAGSRNPALLLHNEDGGLSALKKADTIQVGGVRLPEPLGIAPMAG